MLGLTIHGVTGLTVVDPHRTDRGGATALLRIDTTDGPVEVDLFANSIDAFAALAVEESEVPA